MTLERVCTPAWYADSIAGFLTTQPDQILGTLLRSSGFGVDQAQAAAWTQEIALLRTALAGLDGHLFLEFDVPRLGSRIDAVVVAGASVIPIEFKVGERLFRRADRDQAWDYGLDLKNFHAASHAAAIFPTLVATEAPLGDPDWAPPHPDGVRPPRRCNRGELSSVIRTARDSASGPAIDGAAWGEAPYRPTPTIIEAAQALYARHTVEAISRHDAGARNLTVTSRTVEQIIDDASRDGFKAIVFVTGVPGAGKTLVGLNVATRRRREDEATHAVFLSGNGPLVAVLREALTRDEMARLRARNELARKGAVGQRVKPFIQNVHHFRDEGVRTLTSRDDTRSSWYLEDAATEYQIQGLELDWIVVTWDADLRRIDNRWEHRSFQGNRWKYIRKPERQQYLLNAYRVLLTRARQGMVVFVPPGDRDDPTRLPEMYEGVFEFLASIGVPVLRAS